MIKLYTYVTSPFGMKVHTYLLYKQLAFDVHYVNPLNPKRELPTGRHIPVLQINDSVRTESSMIGLWLDKNFPKTPNLLPHHQVAKNSVLKMDLWVNEVLIPTVFYSIYPKWKNWKLYNTLRLGYCVSRTTSHNFPPGVRFLWPVFIYYSTFIRRLIRPIQLKYSVKTARKVALDRMESALKNRRYLVTEKAPSIADLSAWPQLVAPYEFGLINVDDFTKYDGIMRWIKDVKSHLETENAPLLIPKAIQKKRLLLNGC